MNETTKRDFWTFVAGTLLGVLLVILFICFKNALDFKNNCDGVVVSKQWSLDTGDYCVDPSVLRED